MYSNAGAEALVQLATSFISKEQALFNLPRKDFEETKTEAKESWENLLGRFDVVETGPVDRTFFDHCLYRLFLFPQTFYEVNEQGETIHIDLASGTIKLSRDLGLGVIIVIHDINLAAQYCDELVALKQGRLLKTIMYFIVLEKRCVRKYKGVVMR